MFSRFTSLLPLIVGGAIALFASFLPESLSIFRSALWLFVIVFSAGLLGPRLVSERLPTPLRWMIGGITLVATHSIFQTIWYYAGGRLESLADGLCLGTAIFLLTLFTGFKRPSDSNQAEASREPIRPEEASFTLLAVLSFVAAAMFILLSAWQAATTQSINGAWGLFPPGTLVAMSVLFAGGFLASLKSRKLVVVSLVSVTLLLLASLTIFVYPLGYGFDGFLHRASEAVILETGTLTPAPPSYIGQYTLITWLSRVLRVSHSISDLWLVGALALLLPIASSHLSTKKRGAFTVLGLLIALPLGIISATTPQNVAYILGILALLWLIPYESKDEEGAVVLKHVTSLVVPWILIIWSLTTHPLAGLPFAFAGFALSIYSLRFRIVRNVFISLSLIGSLLVVPLAFSLRAMLQGGTWSWSWLNSLSSIFSWLGERAARPATHLALWPDWANWQLYLLSFLLLGAASLAAVRDTKRRSLWLILIGFSLTASLSSWLLQASGDFSFLISYERQDYAGRLLIVAQLFLIPAALVGIGYWFEKAQSSHPRIRAASLLLGIAWFSANVYNLLPRHDAAAIGHGWNVGRSDLEAVKFIDKQANGEAYTVLANQTVSAAAISSFGFKRYVGDVFYYPIPTGGPLYERFLQMMEQPDADIAKEAGDLGQSKLVYVVVNRYWFRANQIIEKLKEVSDRTWNVERGTAYIFLFDLRNRPSDSPTTSGS